MTTCADLKRIGELLLEVPRAPERPLPPGLTDGVIRAFEERVGVTIPPEQAALLKLSNGPCVGPGGIFGVLTVQESMDIESMYDSYPVWRDKGWVPVAGDGCGNYYLAVRTGEEWPVVFIDTMEDPEHPAFIVASSLSKFVIAILEKELGKVGWPFDEAEVTSFDPRITHFGDAFTLPWDGRSGSK